MFLIHSDIDIANFVDDNTLYLSAKNIEDVIESLERALISLFKWFEKPFKGNADKCHFLVSTSQEVSLNVNNFKKHNTDLCRRASRKIHFIKATFANELLF